MNYNDLKVGQMLLWKCQREKGAPDYLQVSVVTKKEKDKVFFYWLIVIDEIKAYQNSDRSSYMSSLNFAGYCSSGNSWMVEPL